MNRIRVAALSGALALAAATSALAQGDNFPNRPIRLVTLTTAGGSLDLVARTIASGLPAELGQQVVIENKGGGGGAIGRAGPSSASPDGRSARMTSPSGCSSDELTAFAMKGLLSGEENRVRAALRLTCVAKRRRRHERLR